MHWWQFLESSCCFPFRYLKQCKRGQKIALRRFGVWPAKRIMFRFAAEINGKIYLNGSLKALAISVIVEVLVTFDGGQEAFIWSKIVGKISSLKKNFSPGFARDRINVWNHQLLLGFLALCSRESTSPFLDFSVCIISVSCWLVSAWTRFRVVTRLLR